MNQFKPFLILPVVFWLVWKLVQQENGWQILLTSLFVTGTFVAITGLVEYLLPGATRDDPGFADPHISTIGVNSFLRARYSFYGAPTATFMMLVDSSAGFVPVAVGRTSSWHKLLILAG